MADNKEMEVSSVTKCQKFKYPLNLEKARDLGLIEEGLQLSVKDAQNRSVLSIHKKKNDKGVRGSDYLRTE